MACAVVRCACIARAARVVGVQPVLFQQSAGVLQRALVCVADLSLVTVTALRLRLPAAMILVLGAAVPWAVETNWPPSICWKESEVNSVARRAWTHEAAAYLAANYAPGSGVIYSFGDLTGVL